MFSSYLNFSCKQLIVTVENTYDGTVAYLPRTFVANEAAGSQYQEEFTDIICPSAVEPGTFFTCHFYLLDEEFINVQIIDANSNPPRPIEDSTGWMRVPSMLVVLCCM